MKDRKEGGRGNEAILAGIRVELIGKGQIRFVYPNGDVEVVSVENTPKKKEPRYVPLALAVSRLVIPLVSTELQGVDQAGYQVSQEEEIRNLPGGRESNYDEALRWACAVLQGGGYPASRVAEILMAGLGGHVEAGRQLSPEGRERYEMGKARLARELAKYYPTSSRRAASKKN